MEEMQKHFLMDEFYQFMDFLNQKPGSLETVCIFGNGGSYYIKKNPLQ